MRHRSWAFVCALVGIVGCQVDVDEPGSDIHSLVPPAPEEEDGAPPPEEESDDATCATLEAECEATADPAACRPYWWYCVSEGEPPEPPSLEEGLVLDECSTRLYACLDVGSDTEGCEHMFVMCLQLEEPEDPPEPPEPPDGRLWSGLCRAREARCLESYAGMPEAAFQCVADMIGCTADGLPEQWERYDALTECGLRGRVCTESGVDRTVCRFWWQGCLADDPPDPPLVATACESALFECYEALNSPASAGAFDGTECMLTYWSCIDRDDLVTLAKRPLIVDPDGCVAQVDRCLTSGEHTDAECFIANTRCITGASEEADAMCRATRDECIAGSGGSWGEFQCALQNQSCYDCELLLDDCQFQRPRFEAHPEDCGYLIERCEGYGY